MTHNSFSTNKFYIKYRTNTRQFNFIFIHSVCQSTLIEREDRMGWKSIFNVKDDRRDV